jgi:hypothetical protein
MRQDLGWREGIVRTGLEFARRNRAAFGRVGSTTRFKAAAECLEDGLVDQRPQTDRQTDTDTLFPLCPSYTM